MSNKNLTVLIPALKKNVAFQDDVVKKIAGITLIQRAIDKSFALGVDKHEIHLITDSEEIQLIAKRNGIGVYLQSDLIWDSQSIQSKLYRYLRKATKLSNHTLLLSPYSPLLPVKLLEKAIQSFKLDQCDILKPVKKIKQHLFDIGRQSTIDTILGFSEEIHQLESKAFTLIKSKLINSKQTTHPQILAWEVEHDLLEINSFQDWWVCEKLLKRKKIVFRVIGNSKVGMGHIYRALSLAHEITDHEILFVSDINNTVAVNKLAGYDYWLGIYKPEDVIKQIIELKPDLVVNDILSTTKKDVQALQEQCIKVINFEDLGEGAKQADLTINELYDTPQISGDNILWGYNYFFVRDEFHHAKAHTFQKRVNSILLAFGGTDQHNLSSKIYHAIASTCKKQGVKINIITGEGYKNYQKLYDEISHYKNVTITHATGVMSDLMEKSQLAITSNGRTVYELAHMNIPAIVISQHDREKTHSFACTENGFLTVDLYQQGKTEKMVVKLLKRLLSEEDYRHKLFDKTTQFTFDINKQKVLDKIVKVLDNNI